MLMTLIGFLASFYLGCWSAYAGFKKITKSRALLQGIILIGMAIGLWLLAKNLFLLWVRIVYDN
jgi:hypothetical protein